MDFNIDLLFQAHPTFFYFSTLFLKADLTNEEQLLCFVLLFTIHDEHFFGLEMCRHVENTIDPDITFRMSQLRIFLFSYHVHFRYVLA